MYDSSDKTIRGTICYRSVQWTDTYSSFLTRNNEYHLKMVAGYCCATSLREDKNRVNCLVKLNLIKCWCLINQAETTCTVKLQLTTKGEKYGHKLVFCSWVIPLNNTQKWDFAENYPLNIRMLLTFSFCCIIHVIFDF